MHYIQIIIHNEVLAECPRSVTIELCRPAESNENAHFGYIRNEKLNEIKIFNIYLWQTKSLMTNWQKFEVLLNSKQQYRQKQACMNVIPSHRLDNTRCLWFEIANVL